MNFKLIMPMAGDGTRFKTEGYTKAKPIIDVKGKPMFVRAVETIGLDFDDFIFIVQKDHNIKNDIKEHYPDSTVIEIDQRTEGAACTVLLADPYIDDEDSIFVANCDQVIEWDTNRFNELKDNDGIILTFDCPEKDPKWSFARLENDNIVEVAEKNPISTHATTGHYYWNNWGTFKKSAYTMIDKNIRVNGEFYLCPVFNQTIEDGGIIKKIDMDYMHGLGTPEDLRAWLST